MTKKSDQQKSRNRAFTVIGVVFFVCIVLPVLISIPRAITKPQTFANWWGFGTAEVKVNRDEESGEISSIDLPEKTAWDWIELFFTLVGSFGTPFLIWYLGNKFEIQSKITEENRKNQQNHIEQGRKEQQDRMEENRLKENRMQKYLDYIYNLLLEKNKYNLDSLQNIIEVKTQTIVRELKDDNQRQITIFLFLLDAGLLPHILIPVTNLLDTNLKPLTRKVQLKIKNWNLKGIVLIERDLSGIYLEEAIFREAKVENSNFTYANLENGDLSKASFLKCNFSSANLTKAIFNEGYFYESNFSQTHLYNTKFNNSHFEAAIFKNVNFGDVSFIKADLYNVDFSRSVLINVTFDYSGLNKTNFSQTQLFNTSFIDSLIYFSNLSNTYMENVDMKNAKINNANIFGAKIIKAKNLTYDQIKLAKSYEKAYFAGYWDQEQQKYLIDKEENDRIILEIKNY